MTPKTSTTRDEKGRITLVELPTLTNCLPVKDETYSRILHGLIVKGLIKLSGQAR